MGSKFFHGAPLLVGDNTVPGLELSKELKEYAPIILKACRDWGLDFYPTVIQILTYDEISEIAAYGGFPVRFPHWSFGAEYEELQRGYEAHSHKIFEMVINSSPCYQWLLSSNTLVDNLTVIAHATGHNDFFKNNIFFSATDTNMLNKMANHGTRIRKYIARWGKERVTEFIDWVMRLETLIDGAEAWTPRVIKDPILQDERQYRYPRRLNVDKDSMYMEPFINTSSFKKKERQKVEKKYAEDELNIFKEPTKNIMRFLRDNAPLKPWQADIISMLYEEAIYFFPQRQTKTLNEGFACLCPDSLISTAHGTITIKELFDTKFKDNLFDGDGLNKVSNWFKFENRKIYQIETKKGFQISGSSNHRILNSDGEWKQLSDCFVGDKIKIGSGGNLWPTEKVKIDWVPNVRLSKSQLYKQLGCCADTFKRRAENSYAWESNQLLIIEKCNSQFKELGQTQEIRRKKILVPNFVDENLASFFGYMIGDGHISEKRRSLGLTTGDKEQADQYQSLLNTLFDVNSHIRWDNSSKNGRWRISVTSKNLQEFLTSFGFKTGICARIKEIPECIMKSPKSIMSAFIRSYFDCDGYAGPAGVILSTSSEKLGKQIQIILLNYGIVSHRKQVKSSDPKKCHVWQVSIRGKFAAIFRNEIGFGLKRKKDKLNDYVDNRQWFVKSELEDEIVNIKECGIGDVYDITVENTHSYVAQGFINHNSTVDSVIMAEQGYVSLGQKSHDHGIVEYAAHKMSVLGGKYSMNPYKLGFYLLADIRERWDKGQFGTEWDECTDVRKKENWDTGAMLGKEKIFEVRKYYNDFTFLNEFFTEDFCRKQEYFHWKHYPNGEFKLENRDYKSIKNLLLRRHLNGGLPDIRLTEPNYRGKGEIMLQHYSDGRGLYDPYIGSVLTAIRAVWGNDVFLATNIDEDEVVYGCYGPNESDVELVSRKQHLREE